MVSDPPYSGIRRVVVLVDASRASWAALEEGADLAARHGLELLGLFVEEEDILRAATLPIASEVGPVSGGVRPLDPERIQRRLQGQSQEVRRYLTRIAQGQGLVWSLQILRGWAADLALAHTGRGDLLVAGKVGWSFWPRGQRLGSTARELVSRSSFPIMILETRTETANRPIIALFEELQSGIRALEMAIQLANSKGSPLVVLIPSISEGKYRKLAEGAQAALDRLGRKGTLRGLETGGCQALAAAIRRESGRALVISRTGPTLEGEAGQQLIAAMDILVVVIP